MEQVRQEVIPQFVVRGWTTRNGQTWYLDARGRWAPSMTKAKKHTSRALAEAAMSRRPRGVGGHRIIIEFAQIDDISCKRTYR